MISVVCVYRMRDHSNFYNKSSWAHMKQSQWIRATKASADCQSSSWHHNLVAVAVAAQADRTLAAQVGHVLVAADSLPAETAARILPVDRSLPAAAGPID